MKNPDLYSVLNCYCSSIFVPQSGKPAVGYEIKLTYRSEGFWAVQTGTFKEESGCSVSLTKFTMSETLQTPRVDMHITKTKTFPAIRSAGAFFVDYNHRGWKGEKLPNVVLTKPLEESDGNIKMKGQILKLSTFQFGVNLRETQALGTLVLYPGENQPILLESEVESEHEDILLLTTWGDRFGFVTSLGEFYTVRVVPDDDYIFRQELNLIRNGITRNDQIR